MKQGITVKSLRRMKRDGEKIAVLTAYDVTMARLLDRSGVDVALVGDSLGMVVQGRETTLPVSVADMVYHTRCVRHGIQRALVVVDMPFMSYNSAAQAVGTAGRLVREGGAHMVKLEGGEIVLEAVSQIVAHGIPVCGHLGLQPQSVHKLGGYSVRGRDEAAAAQIVTDALALEAAGADMLVLECVPAKLAHKVSESVAIPVIGIGAGGECDGQVLVVYDMLGMTAGKPMKFVHNFLVGHDSIEAALKAYVAAVKTGDFPAEEHIFE